MLDQGIVIPRDREMRESARKGPQDEEALCCSLMRCLVVLASPTVNTYLDLTYNLQHINYLQ